MEQTITHGVIVGESARVSLRCLGRGSLVFEIARLAGATKAPHVMRLLPFERSKWPKWGSQFRRELVDINRHRSVDEGILLSDDRVSGHQP